MNSLIIPSHHWPHVRPAVDGCLRLNWRAPQARAKTERLKRQTCFCMNVRYELFYAGGLAFIRRVRPGDGWDDTAETEWRTTARIEEMWDWILSGRAR